MTRNTYDVESLTTKVGLFGNYHLPPHAKTRHSLSQLIKPQAIGCMCRLSQKETTSKPQHYQLGTERRYCTHLAQQITPINTSGSEYTMPQGDCREAAFLPCLNGSCQLARARATATDTADWSPIKFIDKSNRFRIVYRIFSACGKQRERTQRAQADQDPWHISVVLVGVG